MEMMLKMYSLGFQVSFFSRVFPTFSNSFISVEEEKISFFFYLCYPIGLLRLIVQSFRLFRRDRFDHRDDPDEHSRDATARRFRSPLRPVTQGI